MKLKKFIPTFYILLKYSLAQECAGSQYTGDPRACLRKTSQLLKLAGKDSQTVSFSLKPCDCPNEVKHDHRYYIRAWIRISGHNIPGEYMELPGDSNKGSFIGGQVRKISETHEKFYYSSPPAGAPTPKTTPENVLKGVEGVNWYLVVWEMIKTIHSNYEKVKLKVYRTFSPMEAQPGVVETNDNTEKLNTFYDKCTNIGFNQRNGELTGIDTLDLKLADCRFENIQEYWIAEKIFQDTVRVFDEFLFGGGDSKLINRFSFMIMDRRNLEIMAQGVLDKSTFRQIGAYSQFQGLQLSTDIYKVNQYLKDFKFTIDDKDPIMARSMLVNLEFQELLYRPQINTHSIFHKEFKFYLRNSKGEEFEIFSVKKHTEIRFPDATNIDFYLKDEFIYSETVAGPQSTFSVNAKNFPFRLVRNKNYNNIFNILFHIVPFNFVEEADLNNIQGTRATRIFVYIMVIDSILNNNIQLEEDLSSYNFIVEIPILLTKSYSIFSRIEDTVIDFGGLNKNIVKTFIRDSFGFQGASRNGNFNYLDASLATKTSKKYLVLNLDSYTSEAVGTSLAVHQCFNLYNGFNHVCYGCRFAQDAFFDEENLICRQCNDANKAENWVYSLDTGCEKCFNLTTCEYCNNPTGYGPSSYYHDVFRRGKCQKMFDGCPHNKGFFKETMPSYFWFMNSCFTCPPNCLECFIEEENGDFYFCKKASPFAKETNADGLKSIRPNVFNDIECKIQDCILCELEECDECKGKLRVYITLENGENIYSCRAVGNSGECLSYNGRNYNKIKDAISEFNYRCISGEENGVLGFKFLSQGEYDRCDASCPICKSLKLDENGGDVCGQCSGDKNNGSLEVFNYLNNTQEEICLVKDLNDQNFGFLKGCKKIDILNGCLECQEESGITGLVSYNKWKKYCGCKFGYYLDSRFNVCKKCPDKCDFFFFNFYLGYTCEKNYEKKRFQCHVCNMNDYNANADEKICQPNSPSVIKCQENCIICKEINPSEYECQECDFGFYLTKDKKSCKFGECPLTEYESLRGSEICDSNCLEKCQRCVKGSECLICNEGLFSTENKNKCLSECSDKEGNVLDIELVQEIIRDVNTPYKIEDIKICLECDIVGCSNCKENYKECVSHPDKIIEKIPFFLEQVYDPGSFHDYTLKVRLGKSIENYLLGPFFTNGKNSELFKISNEETPLISKTTLNKEFEIICYFNTTSNAELKKVKIDSKYVNFSPEESKKVITLENKTQILEIKAYEKTDLGIVIKNKQQGETTGEASDASDTASLGLTAISIIGSSDPSGVFIKFNQFLKFIKRVKYIGIYFGDELDPFITSMGRESGIQAEENSERRVLVEESDQNKNDLEIQSKGFKGKFSKLRIYLELQTGLLIKSFFYLFSWVLKIFGNFLWWKMNNNHGLIKIWKLKFLKYQRKIHFLVFNALIMDSLFFNTRIVLHSKRTENSLTKIIFGLLIITLNSLDLAEFTFKTIRMKLYFVETLIKPNKVESKKNKKVEIKILEN